MRDTDFKHSYVEKLTAEVFALLHPIIDVKVDDELFIKTQLKVRDLIKREYVEYDNVTMKVLEYK
jgi:hypothetical protein